MFGSELVSSGKSSIISSHFFSHSCCNFLLGLQSVWDGSLVLTSEFTDVFVFSCACFGNSGNKGFMTNLRSLCSLPLSLQPSNFFQFYVCEDFACMYIRGTVWMFDVLWGMLGLEPQMVMSCHGSAGIEPSPLEGQPVLFSPHPSSSIWFHLFNSIYFLSCWFSSYFSSALLWWSYSLLLFSDLICSSRSNIF